MFGRQLTQNRGLDAKRALTVPDKTAWMVAAKAAQALGGSGGWDGKYYGQVQWLLVERASVF